jgi:hypothetical protein
MNRELRKAIYNKQMLRNKYEKYHTDKTWEAYRKQRNLVTKLKKRSVYHLRLHLFPLKQFFADHLSIFFYKNGLTVCQKLFAL